MRKKKSSIKSESEFESSESSEIILEKMENDLNELFPVDFDYSNAQSTDIFFRYFKKEAKKYGLNFKNKRLIISTSKERDFIFDPKMYKSEKDSDFEKIQNNNGNFYLIQLIDSPAHSTIVVFNIENKFIKSSLTLSADNTYDQMYTLEMIKKMGKCYSVNDKFPPIHHIHLEHEEDKSDSSCSITLISFIRAIYKITKNEPKKAEDFFQFLFNLNKENQEKFEENENYQESFRIRSRDYTLFIPDGKDNKLSIKTAFKWYALNNNNEIWDSTDKEKVFPKEEFEKLKKEYNQTSQKLKKNKKIKRERKEILNFYKRIRRNKDVVEIQKQDNFPIQINEFQKTNSLEF